MPLVYFAADELTALQALLRKDAHVDWAAYDRAKARLRDTPPEGVSLFRHPQQTDDLHVQVIAWPPTDH